MMLQSYSHCQATNQSNKRIHVLLVQYWYIALFHLLNCILEMPLCRVKRYVFAFQCLCCSNLNEFCSYSRQDDMVKYVDWNLENQLEYSV